MRTKLALLGCLAFAGAGIWYLFIRDPSVQSWKEEQDPVGSIQGNSNCLLREVTNASKEFTY